MGRSKPFIFFSMALPFLFILFVLYKQRQLSSSLRIDLDQLKSRVSLLESSIENSERELRSKEDDIAQMVEKMIFEKEESTTSLKNERKGSVDAKGQINAPHSQVAGDENQERISVLKNQLLTLVSDLKPHLDSLTAKTIEAYHTYNSTLVSSAVKLQRSATSFMRELYKYVKPFICRVASVTMNYIGKAFVSGGNLFMKVSVWLLTGLMERLNDFFQWCLGIAAA